MVAPLGSGYKSTKKCALSCSSIKYSCQIYLSLGLQHKQGLGDCLLND
jgi:hypothetical protein